MKTIITIISIMLFATIFTHCGSAAQQLDKKAPFTINYAYYQNWYGGRGVYKGTLVSIDISPENSKKIVFDSLFFNKKTIKLKHNFSGNQQIITGNFIKQIPVEQNMVMDVDPQKEMVNKVPEITINFPFELSDKECVISYTINKKKHYYKLSGLLKKQPIYYP